ncbi:MAG: PorV/PorQ family protein [Flavobacteriales bacterium]
MNTKFNHLIVTIAAFLFAFSSLAQVNAPKYSNEFLAIGVGAKNFGMGNSVISSVDDVTAGYYNPAGLLKIKKNMQVGLMHSEYFAGIAKYDYIGFSKRLDDKSVGAISIIRFGTDDIPNTTQLIDKDGNIDYDRITRFSAADYALIASYARKMPQGLDVGANFKIIHRRIGDFANSWGFGLDASINYEYKKWKFAAVVRDITTTVNAWSYSIDEETREVFNRTGNEIPENATELTLPRILLGSARAFKLSDKFEMNSELNLDITLDGKRNAVIRTNAFSIAPRLGVDLGYKKIVFLRLGLNNVQLIQQFDGSENLAMSPNVGIGIKFKKFNVDYSLSNIGNQSLALYSNVFSLSFGIN